MNNTLGEMIQNMFVTAIDIGGAIGGYKLKNSITSAIREMYQEREGKEWTDKVVEEVDKKVSQLIIRFEDGTKKTILGGETQASLSNRIVASWALNKRWDSNAHLAFVNPKSGADIVARLCAVFFVSNGGIVTITGVEVLMSMLPEELHKSEMSQQIAAKIQFAATPAKHLSKALDHTLSLNEKTKELALQGASAFFFAGQGLTGNYSAPIVSQAVGSVAEQLGIADSKYFGSPAEFFSEDTVIRLWAGALTTRAVECCIRPTVGDGMATFTYMTSHLVTTVGMPMIKDSWVWSKVKSGINEMGIRAVNYFLERDKRVKEAKAE